MRLGNRFRLLATASVVLVTAGCMASANAVPTTVTATATATATAVATPTTTTVTAAPTTITAPPVTVTAPPVTVTAPLSTLTVTVTSTPTTTPTTTSTTTTTTPPPPGTVPPGSEYVAMGDSYSSGEGANQIPGGTPDPYMITGNCRRSSKAAQILLAAQHSWTLVNPACGGSTTAQILNAFGWEQPQMNLVTANTKLTTMTIGGNDVQLLQLITQCIFNGGLPDCTVTNNGTSAAQIAAVDAAINTLEPKIENVVRAIIAKAPQAVIRMAGYPWILPPPGQPVGTCTGLSTAEQSMFDQRLTAVNFAIRQGTLAVAAANPSKNIVYVDPQAVGSPFAVTDNACSRTSTRYMNPGTGDATQWHPNILGQQNYAALYNGSF